MKDYFPSKLAQGEQFCNRSQEKEALHENIKKCRHTILIAPRRYGKSSLVFKVVEESKVPCASIDLFLAHDDGTVTKRILAGVSSVVSQIMPIEQKTLAKLQSIFNKFRISLTACGFSIDASVETAGFDYTDLVFSALEGLSTLAKQQKKSVIVFIDEFQDIRETTNSNSIQGAIRHVAQETSNVVFIFSGSNRRLLLELFDDKSKPLYMLCDRFKIDRIASEHYLPHLQKLANKKWGSKLSDVVFNKIMAITELHPYYVNLLCHELWKLEQVLEVDDVYESWNACFDAHKDRLVAELEKLTTKQQDILKALATHPVVEPTGHNFISASRTPASTINQSIKSLINKDMVYRVEHLDKLLPQLKQNQLRVLDPLLAYALRKYS